MANLALDLDGTLAHWGSDKGGDDLGVGEWMDGAVEALRALRADGHKIVIQSCRATWEAGGGFAAIAAFLRSGGFMPYVVSTSDTGGYQQEEWRAVSEDGKIRPGPVLAAWDDAQAVGIWFGRGKPIAHLYIDDRGVTFQGDWPEFLGVIQRLFVL